MSSDPRRPSGRRATTPLSGGSTRNVIDGSVTARTIVQMRDLHLHLPERPARPDQGPVVVGEIPLRPPSFQERHEPPDQAEVVVLSGPRGVGKTQLAAACARKRIAEGWSVVAWIGAETSGQLLFGLDMLATGLGIRGADDDSEAAAHKVRHWLTTRAPDDCLVVFDNATDVAAVTRWLPAAGNARLLITSTNRAFENLGIPVVVDVFTEPEALAFLRERTGLTDDEGARALFTEVGGLPIALAQAAAVIRTQHIGYATLLERLRALPVERYLTPSPGGAYPHGAAEAVLLSLDATEVDDPLSRPVLELLSLLAPAGVSRELMYAAAGDALPTATEPEIDATLGRLAEASLLTFGLDGRSVLVHRFTQRVVRDRARHDERLPEAIAAAARCLDGMTVPPEAAWDRRTVAESVIQHVEALWEHAAALPDEQRQGTETLLKLRYWAVRQLRETAELTRAVRLGESVLADAERLLGPDHRRTLLAVERLAYAYRHAGRLSEAVALFERSVAERERVLGPEDRLTMTARSDLANAYRESGRLDVAIAMHERNLADRERLFGDDHADTRASRNGLAFTYRVAGRLAEAIALYERNLADRERLLGPEHQATLRSRNNLSFAYLEAGRLDEAIALAEENLAIRERLLGAGHPSVFLSRGNLARAYRTAGRLAEAIALYERNLADRERVLGPDHPVALTARAELALTYRDAGRLPEAAEHYERCVRDRTRVLGTDHPLTIKSRHNLARTHEMSGRRAEAITLYEEVLADYTRILSADHPLLREAREDVGRVAGT